jgi:hypothetical protein
LNRNEDGRLDMRAGQQHFVASNRYYGRVAVCRPDLKGVGDSALVLMGYFCIHFFKKEATLHH